MKRNGEGQQSKEAREAAENKWSGWRRKAARLKKWRAGMQWKEQSKGLEAADKWTNWTDDLEKWSSKWKTAVLFWLAGAQCLGFKSSSETNGILYQGCSKRKGQQRTNETSGYLPGKRNGTGGEWGSSSASVLSGCCGCSLRCLASMACWPTESQVVRAMHAQ